MCLIHIDESAIDVSIIARPSHLCVSFSEKLDHLLDRLDDRRMMHDFQCDVHDWARGDQYSGHYCSIVTLHSYKYLLCHALILISHSFTFLLRFSLSPSLSRNER
jgi:hypothetical protein